MNIIGSSIRFPVTVAVIVFIAAMGGIVSLLRVPVQLTPEVQRPIITVTTNWFGASPEEIEKEIIEQQEAFLKSVEGLVEMQSQSQDGRGVVTLEFEVGVDITGALVRVTNKLNEVPAYPPNVDRPIITSSGPFDNAIAWFTVKADSNVFVPHLLTYLEDIVKPRIERVNGVAAVNMFGGLKQELHVEFDPEMLASMGITISQLSGALAAENRDISAGDFSEGKRRYVVRTVSRYESLDQVRNTVVTVRNGAPIYVRDIAEVRMDHQKPFASVRHKGEPSIAFNIQRQVGANVLQVTDAVLAEVERLNRDVLPPVGIHIENVYRETVYIESAIDLVLSNIFIGGLLTVMSLFIFLRSPSSILVIGVAIPISVVSAFLALSLFGRSINVISLAGMAFAVGMVVDAAIVVLENTYRHMEMGENRWNAAYHGAKEVWGAIFASATTTIAVFLPVLFIQERAGQLFKDISIAICATIGVSLIVAITVIPSLSSRVLKLSKGSMAGEERGLWVHRFADRVAHLVDRANATRRRRLVIVALIVVVAMGLTVVLLPQTEYLPNGNQNFLFCFLLPPPGYNIDEVVKIGQSIEGQLEHLYNTKGEEAKSLPGGGIDNFFFVALPSQAFYGMTAHDPERVRELIPLAQAGIMTVPGAFGLATQASLFQRGFAGTRSVRLDISGPQIEGILGIAAQVFGQVGKVLPGSNSRPIPALDLGNPEVRVQPDRMRAADAGFTATEIGRAVNALVDGAIVTDYWYQGRQLDLIIKGRADWTRHTQDVAQLPMATPSGRIVTVGDVADVTQRQGPVQINHVERQRTVSIETVLPEGIALEEAMSRIESRIVEPMRRQGQIGGLFDVRLSGTADDLTRLKNEMFGGFNVAIILTFLLLAALFQSYVYPFVVMLTVPLGAAGGIVGLRIVQLFDSTQQLDVLTMLGFVILVGTVVNNSILLVYYALDRMREGVDPREAVKDAVRVRVRPIFMTTGTTVCGMLPLVIMPGAGSELYRGMGAVIVGGLVLSTVVTLFLTPLVFTFALEGVTRVRTMFGLNPAAVSKPPDFGAEK